MLSPLAPLLWQHAQLDRARQYRQISLLWRELATEVRRDSDALCSHSDALCSEATEVCLRSRHIRAQRAALRAEIEAQCLVHVSPE